MKKLVCKYCGNAEFYVLNFDETMCKCGFILTKPSDYKMEEPKEGKKPAYKLKADLIVKISLLKGKIDICLDEGNKEKFLTLASELNKYEKQLKAMKENRELHMLERFKQNQD
jgi:hypothetical protein